MKRLLTGKTAIFHDYFDEIGGAEITLLVLARALNVPIITTSIDKKTVRELGYDDVAFLSVGSVPTIRHVRQIMAKWRFFRCDFSGEFDFFIFGGGGSVFASARHRPNLWYCFSPERGLYDLRDRTRFGLKKLVKELLIILDKHFAKQIETIVAPSGNVRSRIRKYYNRNSEIIHSPVSTGQFYFRPPGDYWLCVTRIDPYKRLELQLAAFKKLPQEKLLIVGPQGNSAYFTALKQTCPENVFFYGPVYETGKLTELYARCRGLIATSLDEDFGMTPVEAMASGKPVIAPNEGGYRETVADGLTGRLIDRIDPDRLAQAITEMGRYPEKYREACLKRAGKFDRQVFIGKLKRFL
ncbi:MAG: glycosyltransferase [bacterium]